MKQLTAVVAILLFVNFCACSKPGDNDPSNDPPTDSTDIDPPAAKSDSIRLLAKIEGTGSPGNMLFEYDNENRLVTAKIIFNNAAPIINFFFYKNGKLSTVITQNGNQKDKASAVLYYNANGLLSKVVYKRDQCCLANDDPFYHTITDSNDIAYRDTLVYNSSGQLTQLYTRRGPSTLSHDVRFTFNATSDSIPSQIDETVYSPDGTVFRRYGLFVNTNRLTHPGLRDRWALYSMNRTNQIAGTAIGVTYPILFDDEGGASLSKYLCLFPKCVTTYNASENGTWNNGLGGFVYSYNADSSVFQGTVPNAWPTIIEKFTFRSVKK